MKKNCSLILLSLLATTTISLAMDAEDWHEEGDKKRRFSRKPVSTLGDGIDVTVKGNKRSRPSTEPASTLDDAVAESGEGGDSSYSQSVLPTTLTSSGGTQWDEQIMKEARDVLAVMQGAVSTDTLVDIYEILSFARDGHISYDDEKLSADGLKTALSAFSTLDAQVGYIDEVFGSFFAKNPHLVGFEPSPQGDGVGGSGYSSQVEDDGLEEYGEDPEATSYGSRADDGAESEDEEGEDEEEDNEDHLGYVDYGSDDDDGNEEYGEKPEAANYGVRGEYSAEDEGEEEGDDEDDEDEDESDDRSSSSGSSESESEIDEDDGRYEEDTQSILTVIKKEDGFDIDKSRKAIKGILVCLDEERIILAEGKPTVDMLRQTLSALPGFKEQLDYIDALCTTFINQNPALAHESPREKSYSDEDDELDGLFEDD